MGQKCFGDIHCPPKIDIDDAFDFFEIQIVDFNKMLNDAGIIDDPIYRPMSLDDRFRESLNRFPVRDIRNMGG